jgi:hypothetical protein
MTKRPPPVYVTLRHSDMLWLATYIAFILWVWKRLNERANTPAEPTAYQYDAPVNYLDRQQKARQRYNQLNETDSDYFKSEMDAFRKRKQAQGVYIEQP